MTVAMPLPPLDSDDRSSVAAGPPQHIAQPALPALATG